MSDQQKLSDQFRQRMGGTLRFHDLAKVAALEKQLAEAIRERDEARAELKTRTESLHTAVRLKLQAQSQRDALERPGPAEESK